MVASTWAEPGEHRTHLQDHLAEDTLAERVGGDRSHLAAAVEAGRSRPVVVRSRPAAVRIHPVAVRSRLEAGHILLAVVDRRRSRPEDRRTPDLRGGLLASRPWSRRMSRWRQGVILSPRLDVRSAD